MKIEDVKALRQKSGLGLMECKTALEEAGGDMQLAEDNLRKQGLSNMDGRTDRDASEGTIAISRGEGKCAIVQIDTETDFTAKSDIFRMMAKNIADVCLVQPVGPAQKTKLIQDLIDDVRLATKENVTWNRGEVLEGRVGTYLHHDGKTGVVVQVDGEIDELHKICLHVASVHPEPLGVHDYDIPGEILDKEREIAKAQVMGKPENIIDKIVGGKINKFLDKVVLLRQKLVMDNETKVEDLLGDTKIVQFVKYKI